MDTPVYNCLSTMQQYATLAALSTVRRFGELVFATANGQPIRKSNFLRREFGPLLIRTGVRRITFHALRHTANTLLLIEGVSPNVVAQRMGHSSTRMTLDTYGHVLTGAQRAAADKLDAIFGAASQELSVLQE